MPTYDYKCPSCGFKVETCHSMDVSWQMPCPPCSLTTNKSDMVKVPSAGAGVHFKGSGFYETDYKGK